jgi:hypothetical protein
LTHRAHAFCDDEKDLSAELKLLGDVFISNGYPRKLVQKTIEKSWEIEMQKWAKRNIEDPEKNTGPQEFYDVIHAPYVEGFSEKVQRRLKKLNVGFVMKVGDTVQSSLSHLKAPMALTDQKDMVYAIRCKTCYMNYIGETGQSFTERRKQHQYAVRRGIMTNGIFQHVQKNIDHEIDWENPVILDKEGNWIARKIKESIRINSLNPMPVITELMNLERGKEIDSIWNRFDRDVGEETKKLVSRGLRSVIR